jgi:GT2 family glycosyltransferase
MLDTLRTQVGISEVVVVDDGSHDGTAEAVQQTGYPWPVTVISQSNRGPAAARNAGWRATHGELILFLDDDMLCAPGLALAHAAAHADHTPAIAIGAIRLSDDSPRTLATLCFEREFAPHAKAWHPVTHGEWIDVPVVFSNTSLPRTLLETSGGFDEAFRMREDLELGYRLLRSGVVLRSVPRAIALQQYTKTEQQLLKDAEVFALGDVLFARKHPDNRVRGQLNWLHATPHATLELAGVFHQLTDQMLTAACALGESVPKLQSMGVRALVARRRLRWFRCILEQAADAQRVRALVALKLVHTVAWAFFASAILAVPMLGFFGLFKLAGWLAGIVFVECAVVALNHWRCPISNLAERLTSNRQANFDIYLPESLALWNKHIFGTLFVVGLLILGTEWWRAFHISH